MAASVVGAARTPSDGTDATGASLALTIPAGTAVDDYALILVELWDSTATNPTLTYPSGFTQVANYVSTTDGFQKMKAALKKLTAADSGTYSVSGFASHFRQGHVIILRGIDATTALDVAINLAQNSSGTTLPANSLTTVTAGCLLVFAISNENTSTGTPSTGYTEQLDSNYLKTNTKVAGSAGTETPSGGSFSASTLKLGMLFAFRPASTGASMTLDAAAGTGAAQTLSTAKDLAFGAASGTGAAQALAPSKQLSLGTASGTGTPQAMTFSKGLTFGAATGSGAPAAITHAKSLALGTAAGAGSPQTLAPGKDLGLQAATGSGTAQPATFGAAGSMALGPATGTGQPQAMTFSKAWTLSAATGSGAAQQLAAGKAWMLGAAAGSGSPRALASSKLLAYATAQGSGTPFALELTGPLPDYSAPDEWTVSTRDGATVSARGTPYTVETRQLSYTATTRED